MVRRRADTGGLHPLVPQSTATANEGERIMEPQSQPSMVAVKLTGYPADGGIVVSCHATVADYYATHSDRDGCMPGDLRLWAGVSPVGTRVTMRQYP